MSDYAAANVEAERAVRDYYRECDRIERATLAAVRCGELVALPADVALIARAVLAMPEAERGIAVDSLLIDRDDAHMQWVVLIMLSSGAHRSLAVSYPQ